MTISSKEKDKENVQKNNNKDRDGGVPSAKEVGEQDSTMSHTCYGSTYNQYNTYNTIQYNTYNQCSITHVVLTLLASLSNCKRVKM